jgi:hypothetical protein
VAARSKRKSEAAAAAATATAAAAARDATRRNDPNSFEKSIRSRLAVLVAEKVARKQRRRRRDAASSGTSVGGRRSDAANKRIRLMIQASKESNFGDG